MYLTIALGKERNKFMGKILSRMIPLLIMIILTILNFNSKDYVSAGLCFLIVIWLIYYFIVGEKKENR